jgi:iron complex transport system substrate-binding protein
VKTPAQQLGTTELDFEKIANLQPDLILNTRSDNSKDTYDTLSKIAPTVYGPAGVTSYGTSWEQQVTSISEAVGLAAKGQQLIADTKKKLADFASANPDLAGKTFAAGAAFGTDQWAAYVSGDLRVDFLTALGMKNKPEIESQKKDSFFVSVSPEKLSIFDADLTLMFAIGDNESALEGNSVLKNLPSTKAGHELILTGDDAQAYSTGSTLAIDYALQNVAPKIVTAVKGS